MNRSDLTAKKAARVVEWLRETKDGLVVKTHKQFTIVAGLVGYSADKMESIDESTMRLDVFTQSHLARWFDAANLYMRQEVVEWEDAMAQCWPADEDVEPVLDSIEAAEEQAA